MIFYWDSPDLQNFPDPGWWDNKFDISNRRNTFLELSASRRTDIISDTYDKPGVWYIQLRDILMSLVDATDPDVGGKTTILGDAIPDKVWQGIRDNKLLLAIDNSLEGQDLSDEHILDFHQVVSDLDLPAGRIIIFTGGWLTEATYIKQCQKLDIKPQLHFVPWQTLPSLDTTLDARHASDYWPILTALADPNSKDFLSLNQTVKPHRTEHVYYCIINDLIDKGLFNASLMRRGEWQDYEYRDDPEGFCTYNTDKHHWEMLVELHRLLPLHADHDLTHKSDMDLPGTQGMYSTELYEKTLLSFVTESEYHQDTNFITEKTYKCLLAGHPFIVLGNCGTIAHLNAQGFRTDLCGIDHSYDSESDHIKRFHLAHAELERWINTDIEEKRELIHRDLHKFRYNRRLCEEKLFYPFTPEDYTESDPKILQTLVHQEIDNIGLFLETKLEDL